MSSTVESTSPQSIRSEAERRRTFAIISHPDAGKTTLTEKLLLCGGRVDVAGVVKGRKSHRSTASDWMEIERQRGISVSSTVLPFEFRGTKVNLLDTPGHHDFSEDTYRTLTAADSAVMVIDMGKGVEPQTQKLFEVCSRRSIPIVTFVNKIDRQGREPLELLSEIEERLGIDAVARQWPIGAGHDYQGLFDLSENVALLARPGGPDLRVPASELEQHGVPEAVAVRARSEAELVQVAGHDFDRNAYLNGKLTPVYFGSALKDFGVERFLEAFLELSPPPAPRESDAGLVVDPGGNSFSGFIFKIQANLDPRHRDRVAFMRVCSGRFERDMEVSIARTGAKVRLGRAHLVFGQQRETVDEAYAGDIVGLVNPGVYRLGDTLSAGHPVRFRPMPPFPPEYFARIRCPETDKRKQFERGLTQLLEEGAIQVFTDPKASHRDQILGAVGELQFDVVRHRLSAEYGVETLLDWLPYKLARWIDWADATQELSRVRLPYGARLVEDQHGGPAILFQTRRETEFSLEQTPGLRLLDTPILL